MNTRNILSASAALAEVEKVMSARWNWGSHDCCTSACDVFLALWGIDPMAPIRGQYDSATGAARIIRDWGGFPAMADALARNAALKIGNGSRPGEIGLSSPGDAGGPDGRALLICINPGAWAGKSELGFTILPGAERSWYA